MAENMFTYKVVTPCNQQGDCIYCYDEFCIHPDCPMRADYCPVPNDPGVCRYEDRRGEDG